MEHPKDIKLMSLMIRDMGMLCHKNINTIISDNEKIKKNFDEEYRQSDRKRHNKHIDGYGEQFSTQYSD